MKKEKNHKLYRKMGFYERYIKRAIDIFCSGLAIIVFCWLYAIIALLVRIKLGSPVLFTQYRPGLIDPKTGKERIFKMYKFRPTCPAFLTFLLLQSAVSLCGLCRGL